MQGTRGFKKVLGASKEVDGARVLTEVCNALSDGDSSAADILQAQYPFSPRKNVSRNYNQKQMMQVFLRDGFIDRYSGKRLVFPGALRLISNLLPDEFPFHSNWKTDACHFAYWELCPTIDHEVPVSRGGVDDESNWVTTSMMRNSAKSNFTLQELGWRCYPSGDLNDWDGLTNWFQKMVDANSVTLSDTALRKWNFTAKAVMRGRS